MRAAESPKCIAESPLGTPTPIDRVKQRYGVLLDSDAVAMTTFQDNCTKSNAQRLTLCIVLF